MNKMKVLIGSFFINMFFAFGSDLKLSQPILYSENGQYFGVITISWENSWHNYKNHDAVWLSFKSILPKENAVPVFLQKRQPELISSFNNPDLVFDFEVADNGSGVFIYPKTYYRGSINITVKVFFKNDTFNSINTRRALLKGYGLEMVYIPEGTFALGEPSENARKYGSLYMPNSDDVMSYFEINSENSLVEIGQTAGLYYDKHEGYEGDQTGQLLKDFPKGYDAFYIMKYEISEGQYCDFLNSLKEEFKSERDITKAKDYYNKGGSIINKVNIFETPHINKPCKFMSWDDAMAFSDWFGLRPMTEFEFTKAARGDRRPIVNEFPWGTASKLKVQRLPDEDGNLKMNNYWLEDKLSEDTLEYFGASYYWVMDLSGSMWERVISIGSEGGRQFLGSHGDGILSDTGEFTNEDWPGNNEADGGIGFRGGGFYGYNRSYHEYNPFSPIAFRTYGGWHGTMRSEAYGGRLVRTSRN